MGPADVFGKIGDAVFGAGAKIANAPGAAFARVLEAYNPPTAYDPDENLSATGGGSWAFSRLSGKQPRDLAPITHDRMISMAFHLQDSNPVAKRGLEAIRDFVLGDGVSIYATAESETAKAATQAVIDKFWHDPMNQLDIKLPNKIYELALFGEQCYPVFVNPVDGHVRLGYLDPGVVNRVILDPENAEIAIAIEAKPGSAAGPKRLYKVISVDEDPLSPTFGLLVGAAEGERLTDSDGESRPYTGSCFWFAINKVSTATRGRSDLLNVADWIDAHDNVLFTMVDRAMLMLAFIWDVKVEGADAAALEEFIKQNPPPKPGSVRAHNEAVEWKAAAPDLRSFETKAESEVLLGFIATGLGIPKTWLSATDDVNKATAQELGEPAFKRLSARQRFVRFLIRQLLNFALDQAVIAKRLEKPEGVWEYSVVMPELRTRDLSQIATTMFQVVQGLVMASTEGFVDTESAQEAMVLLLNQMGLDVDLTSMRQRIEDEAAEEPEPPALPDIPDPAESGLNGQSGDRAGVA